jgi:hypothetical protein
VLDESIHNPDLKFADFDVRTPEMTYTQIREQIQSGDVLGVRGHGLFPSITRHVQRLGRMGALSGITHAGVAWWVEGRLYSVEMDGKHNVLRPLSQYINSGLGVDIYRCPVALEHMRENFDKATALPISYDIMDLFRIGSRLIFGTSTGQDDDKHLVCSTFASRWMQWSGWQPPEGLPAMPSPAELCQSLGEAIFSLSPES